MYDRLPISLNLAFRFLGTQHRLLVSGLVRLLMICTVAGGAAAVQAEVVRWLYDVEVRVASQSDSERRRAGRVALTEVLQRVAGVAQLPAHPDLAAARRQPDSFYSRYNYAFRPLEKAAAGDDGAEDAQATFLAIQFEPGPVLALLRRAGLPVWAANRPAVHAWVVVQRNGERELIAADASAFAEAVARRGRQRGVELSLPLLDMVDLRIAASDVWGLFWEEIERASGRYGPDLLLVGRVREDDDGSWLADWRLRSRTGEPRHLYAALAVPPPEAAVFDVAFEQRTANAAAAASAAVDGVADALAGRFAVHGTLDAVDVVVYGIDTIAHYAALLQHLHSREYIERLEIRAAEGDALALRLHSRSSPRQLRELLAFGGQLRQSASADPSGALALSWEGAE